MSTRGTAAAFLADMTAVMEDAGASYMEMHFTERHHGKPPVYVLVVQGAEQIADVRRVVAQALDRIDGEREAADEGGEG